MKKFLMYCGIYILITLSTTFGVITINKPTSANSYTIGTGDNVDNPYVPVEEEDDDTFTSIINKVMASKALNIDASISIDTGDQNINIDADINLDMSQGITAIAVDGDIVVSLGNTDINVHLTYVDGAIYIDVLGGSYMMKTSDIMSCITKITTLLGIEMPSLDMDMSNLDVNAILALLQDINEVELDDVIEITVTVPTIGKIKIVCDKEYNIKNLEIPKTEIKGVTLGVDANIDTFDSVIVTKPTNTYIDVTDVFNMAEGIINFAKQDLIGLQTKINYNNTTYNANITIDTKNLSLYLNTNIKDIEINIYYINNTLYLDALDLYIKFDINDIDKLLSILKDNGIEISSEMLTTLIKSLGILKLGDIDLSKLNLGNIDLNNIDLTNLDLSKIDLGILTNFECIDNTYFITINGIGDIELEFNNHKFSRLSFQHGTIEAELNAFTPNPISLKVDESTYINLSDYFNFITPIKNIIDNRAIALYGTISIPLMGNTETITISNININFENINNITATAKVSVLGLNINVTYLNKHIYLAVDDLKVEFGINQTKEIIDWINSTFKQNINFDSTNVIIEKVINSIKDNIKSFSIKDYLKDIYTTPTGLFINLNIDNQKIAVNLDYTDTLNKIMVDVNDDINITLFTTTPNYNDINIDTTEYDNINYILDTITNTYNLINTKKLNLTGNISYDKYSLPVELILDYSDGLKAQFATSLLEKAINVIYLDNTLYFNIDEFKAKYNVRDINKLIDEINRVMNKNIDINGTLNNLVGKNNSLLSKIKINKISKVNTENGFELNLNVTYDKYTLDVVLVFTNNTLSDIRLWIDKIKTELNVTTHNYLISVNDEDYKTNIDDLVGMIEPVYNAVVATSLRVDGYLDVNILGGVQRVKINHILFDYNDIDNIKFSASLSLYNITIELTYSENTIFARIDNIKVYIEINQIGDLIKWINDTFKTNIKFDTNITIDKQTIQDKLKNYVIGNHFMNIAKTSTGVIANLNSYKKSTESGTIYVDQNIALDFNSYLTKLTIDYKDIYAQLNFSDFNKSSVTSGDRNEYKPYTRYTTLISKVYEQLKLKQYKVHADSQVWNGEGSKNLRYDVDIDLNLDVINGLKVEGKAIVSSGKEVNIDNPDNMVIDLNYYDQYMYVNFNDLKIKMCENDIKQLIVVALNLLDMNYVTQMLPFLQDSVEDIKSEGINFGALNGVMPGLNLDNPLSMLSVIKEIKYDDDIIKLILDGTFITPNKNADEMTLVIDLKNDRLNNISLTKIFTGVTDNEYFDLNIAFEQNEDVTPVSEEISKTYIDISGTVEFIKAIINTSELTNFHINGNIKVTGTLFKIIPISWDINLDLQVQLEPGTNKPIIMATIGEIPAPNALNNIYDINKDGHKNISNRMIYIYIKDGYVYMYRSEQTSVGLYERAVKATTTEVLDDLMPYVQFATGFSDTIMNAISDSINNNGQKINLGNLIAKDKNGNYLFEAGVNDLKVTINMEEVTHDTKMGNLSLSLGMINNDDTHNKNYVGTATLAIDMPLAKNVFELEISSNDLKLIDIGKTLDFTKFYMYTNAFDHKYEAGVFYECTGASDYFYNLDDSGNLQIASEITHTLTFVSNTNTDLGKFVAKAGEKIPDEYLHLDRYGKLNKDTNYIEIYEWIGWYTTSNFESKTKFNSKVMPKTDTTLYAKWSDTPVEYITPKYYTITFNSNRGSDNRGTDVSPIQCAERATADLRSCIPTKKTYYEKGKYVAAKGYKYTVYNYQFDGWYLDSDCTQKFSGTMPSNDITLYAKWSTTITTEYYPAFGKQPSND